MEDLVVMTTRFIRTLCRAALIAAIGTSVPSVQAAPLQIRLAKQFSMGYVQFNILERRKLIEKHAKAQGLDDINVTWTTFNGPDAMNLALLSGDIDVVAGGVPGMLTLWAKTKGTAQEVRGVCALSSQPILLNTRNPRIKTIRDFGDGDRIAMPAVKVSVHAITLQMAVAQAFGMANYAKLDPLTMSLSPPDSTIGLLSGGGAFNAVFGVPPFQYQQLANPGIHTVLDSFEVLGGAHSFTVAWTSRKFHDGNPRLYRALIDALKEATEILNADKRAAATLWIEDSKSKLPVDMVYGILKGPEVKYTLVPQNTMKFAKFMHEVGTIKVLPASWRDYFFPEIHDLSGS
jgi:NitT/TauT family transport system substrate-binding protein